MAGFLLTGLPLPINKIGCNNNSLRERGAETLTEIRFWSDGRSYWPWWTALTSIKWLLTTKNMTAVTGSNRQMLQLNCGRLIALDPTFAGKHELQMRVPVTGTSFAINKIAATITVTQASETNDGNPFWSDGWMWPGLEKLLWIPSVTLNTKEYNGSNWGSNRRCPINEVPIALDPTLRVIWTIPSGSSELDPAFEINQ